jgi:hypothetical protein
MNLISILKDDEGHELHEHEDNAKLLWESYNSGRAFLNFHICIMIYRNS